MSEYRTTEIQTMLKSELKGVRISDIGAFGTTPQLSDIQTDHPCLVLRNCLVSVKLSLKIKRLKMFLSIFIGKICTLADLAKWQQEVDIFYITGLNVQNNRLTCFG